jgi:hypothetical protein
VHPHAILASSGQAASIIRDLNEQRSVVDREMHAAVLRRGVPHHIGHRFLGDAVGSYLHGSR